MLIQRSSNLEFEHWDALTNAISYLIADGTYDRLVRIHSAGRHRMHGFMSGDLGYKRFLPWHRAYLIVFERELRRIHPALSIPYWHWPEDAGRLVGFPRLEALPFPESIRPRHLGTLQGEPAAEGREPWFGMQADIDAILALETYDAFTAELEDGPHNAGHRWIGGDMASLESPRDPAFWFHHAQIDRIWTLWQAEHPDQQATFARNERMESALDPWPREFRVESVNDTRDIRQYSYEYV